MSGVKSPLDTMTGDMARTEGDNYEENTRLIKNMLDYFKEGFECYMMLCKQSKSTKVLDEINCQMIIQLIERGRYGTTIILEGMKNIRSKIIAKVGGGLTSGKSEISSKEGWWEHKNYVTMPG